MSHQTEKTRGREELKKRPGSGGDGITETVNLINRSPSQGRGKANQTKNI